MGNLIKYPEDTTTEERESLQKYMNDGLPGFVRVNETDIFKWFELYISGKTYSEISKITNSNKSIILYISHKAQWNDKKLKYYNDLFLGLTNKLTQVKLRSANTIVTIVTALGKFYENKFNDYLSKNDKSIIEKIDTKLLSQYYKSMDALEKLMCTPGSRDDDENKGILNAKPANPSFSEDSQDIEINDENAGEILKMLARAKKIEKK